MRTLAVLGVLCARGAMEAVVPARPCLARLVQDVVPSEHRGAVAKLFEGCRLSRAVQVAKYFDDEADLQRALSIRGSWIGDLWRHSDAAGTSQAEAASRQVLPY